MSSTVTGHKVSRFVRQGKTAERVAVTAMDAAVAQGAQALLEATWRATSQLAVSMPPHDWSQTDSRDYYDAYRFCGDYNGTTKAQHVFTGASCYTLTVMDDARTGAACNIEKISGTAHGDRWLAGGAHVSVYPSASPVPPAWDDVLDAEATAAIMAVTPSNTGADSTANWTVTLASPIDATTVSYLHVVVRLADYAVHRGAWVEGSAILDHATLAVTYSRAVAADARSVVLAYGGSGTGSLFLPHVIHTSAYSPKVMNRTTVTGQARYATWLHGWLSGSVAPMTTVVPSGADTLWPAGFVSVGDPVTGGRCSGLATSVTGHMTPERPPAFTGLAFATTLTPPANVVLRLTVWGLTLPLSGTDFDGVDNTLATPQQLSDATAAARSLWSGNAASMTVSVRSTSDAGLVGTAAARLLATLRVSAAIAGGTVLPINWPNPPEMFGVLFCLSPEDVTADLALTAAGSSAASVWSPGNVTLSW